MPGGQTPGSTVMRRFARVWLKTALQAMAWWIFQDRSSGCRISLPKNCWCCCRTSETFTPMAIPQSAFVPDDALVAVLKKASETLGRSVLQNATGYCALLRGIVERAQSRTPTASGRSS